jgi:hypothetical protein
VKLSQSSLVTLQTQESVTNARLKNRNQRSKLDFFFLKNNVPWILKAPRGALPKIREDGFNSMRTHDVNWHKFWLTEVVILSVPVLVTVFATGGRAPVSPTAVEILVILLATLTAVNLFLGLSRQSGWRRR